MIQVKNSTIHYINERALTFSENDLNDPMRVAVSLVSGTVIMAYVPGTIDYAADGNYERWTLKGYSTLLVNKEAHYVYARLSRTDRTALIVFSVKDYNIDGSITTVAGKDENGNDITETTDPSADYFYIKIGELTATDGISSRELTYDSGLLSTKKGDSMTESSNMWELIPGVDPLINALHKLKDFTVKGFITFVGGLKFSKGKEGDEKVIADVKRSVDSDNEYILNQDGTPALDELGNPMPNPDYVPVSDDTLPTTKYLHGKLEGFDDKYLRKDQDDRTAHSLSIGGKTTAEGGIQIGSEFASGLTGYGANIDGKGQAELHSLFVRTFLEVPEMRYNRITVRMGDEINSVSAGIIERVEPSADGSGTGTLWLKLEDGEFGSLEVDDLVMQIFSDMRNPENNAEENSDDGKGNRTMKGFATVYFEVVSVSGDRNEKIEYKLREDARQIHPYAMGPFSQRGNRSNAERQTIIYQGIYPKPYTRYMTGVNQWEFTFSMIGMQLGDLSNLKSAFGQDMSGYSAYLNNIYYTGFMFELTPQQKAELSAYSVSLSEYVGSVRVDSEGNVMAGEYTPVNVVTGEGNVVTGGENVVTGEYLLQTRVQAFKGEKELSFTSGIPVYGQFTCSISGVGCTAGISNGVISVTSVENFNYCYVKIETLCEGKTTFYNTYQVKVIKDGTSAFYADIDNEMDSVACDEKGKVLFGLPVSCNVSAWYGQRQLDIKKMELSAPEGVTAVAVQDEEGNYTGKVEVSAITAEAADTMQIGIAVYAELFGETESRKLTFTVNKVKQGESAVLYKLLPSVDSVKVNDAGTADAENVSCKVLKVTSLGAEELSSLEGTRLSMKYRTEKEDGEKGEFSDYTYLDAVGVDRETRSISFLLYQDGLLIDSETVPVVKDGNAIKEVGEFYLASSYGYGEGVTREDGEWGTWVEGVIPELSKEKKYLWNYEVISYSGIDPTYTEPAIIAMWTEDGKGVKNVYEWYQVNNDKDNSPSYPHVEGDAWVRDTAPVMSEDAKYLWNYEEIHWTDGSVTYTEPAMIGAKGETGATTPVLSVSHGTVSRNSLGVFDPATVIVSVRRGVKDDELWLSAFGIRVNEDSTEDAFYLGSTDKAVSRWNVELNQWSVAIDQNNITSVVFRAYLDFVNSYSDPGIAEHGITFVQQGEVGEPGPMPRNRGEYDGSTEYFYNDEYRDYVWKAGGFVYLRQGRGYTGEGASKGAIIGIEPNGTEETEYWVPASVSSLTAINTALIDNADIAGFKFKDNLMVSQDFHYISNLDGEKKLDATIILDGETGYFKCTDADVRGSITAGSMSYKIRQGGGDLTGYGMAAGEGDYILPEISEGEILEIKALCTSLRRRADFTFSTQNGDLIYVKSDWGNSFVSSEKVELESNVLYTFTSVYDEDSGKMVWVLSKSLGDANAIDGVDGSFIDAEMSETSINPVQNKVITAELKKYVTLAGDTVQTVSRDTDFTGALKVNGSPIVYDKANEYWKLDGDLLVTGAVTMFANEGKYTPSTIMDGVNVDGTTIIKSGNKLMLNPDLELGGGASSWDDLEGKPSWIGSTKPEYNYSEIKNTPTIDSNISDTSTNAVQNKVISSKSFISGRGNIDYDSLDLYNSSTNPFRNSGSVGVKVYDSYGTHQHSDSLYTFRSNGSYWGFEIHQDFSANTFRIRSLKDTGGYTEWKALAFDGDYLKLSGGTMAGTIKSQAIYPKTTNAYELGTSSYLWSNLHTKKMTIDGVEVKKSQDGVLYIDGNLIVTGAVTMFGTDSVTASTVMDGVNVDGTTIIKSGNKLMLNPDLELGGGGLDESALASYLTTNKYLTQTTGDARYVTALGASGNYLTYTKNGEEKNVTVPYATTAKELTSYSAVTFSKSDNSGKPCYLLIADVTSWYNVSSGAAAYGVVGFLYGYRDGATPAYSMNIAARCAYGKGYYSLNSSLKSIVEPRVVSYNGKYYLALFLKGSNRTFNFIGRKNNLLSSFTELQCSDGNGTYSGLSVIYKGSATGTSSKADSLSTSRTISISGHATGSGSFDGSEDLDISIGIPTRNVYINGTGYTVHSTITDDTTGIYAPTSGGTSGYVLKANGTTSIPTWVAQSSLSVGTAAKLSTVSKTAWGQTYWTSGGVPASISGDMSNVGNITFNAAGVNVGEWSKGIGTLHANVISSGGSANSMWLVGSSSSDNYGVVFARNTTGDATGEIARINNKGFVWASGVVGKIVTTGQELQFKYNNSDSSSVVLRSDAFKPFNTANKLIELGTNAAHWEKVWTCSVDYRNTSSGLDNRVSFGDTYVGLTAQSSGAQLVVENTSVRTNSFTSYRVPLGKVSVPWSGIYLGSTSSANNKVGINFCDSSGNTQGRIGSNTSGAVGVYAAGNVFLRGGCTAGSDSMTVGSVGVTIDPSGNVLATGGITMYGSSDKRLKKNIRTFQAGKELMSLGGVYQFEYEDEEISRNGMYKGTHVGLIYQNVKGTILDKMCYERGDGYGALNYLDSSFISLLAGVGVEHETRIQRLERENEELRKEIEQLKNK